MKEFILNNWYYLLLAALALTSFIVSLIMSLKKKGTDLLTSAKEALLENIPFWAVISENMTSGEDKKNNVLSLGLALVSKILGKKLNADETAYFMAFIADSLEKVLATPQKKLQPAKIDKKTKYTV